ncbi:MAG TPA: protein kinase [Kofleriaceae bacterium]|nr:protein kinase [Kofleriaceae bacterium]
MNEFLEIGTVVAGRYEVRARTLNGPAYADYRVFDREIEVEVSLWWMDPTLYGDENPRAAFESGARQVKKLSHPHVRRLYEAGRAGSGLYAALQLGALDPTLSRLGGGRPASEMDILRYATALTEGLEAGHGAGHVHGRLVPADIVDVAGHIKISGIGLYRGLDPVLVAERWGDLRRYLAPEVLESGAATPRSDVFSMGAILAELASGMAHRDLRETIELLAGDQGALADILARAVARSPDKRPGRPAELIGLVRRLYVDSSRATIDRGEVPPEVTPTTLPSIDDEGLDDKTIEESSPLFKDPSAAPKSPLFGPNAPTLLGRRAAPGIRPPTAVEPPAPLPPRAEPPVVVEPMAVERSPEPLMVQVQSHKPTTPVPPPATPILPAIDRPEMQPVLRPISAVAKPSYPPGALGNYAPPVAAAPAVAARRRRWPWVLLIAMLIAAAAGLAIGLAVTSRRSAGGEDDTVEAVQPDQPAVEASGGPAAAPPQPVVRPVEPCAAEMLLVQGDLLRAARHPFCIDRHEAPGSGKPPRVALTREAAQAACQERGARLCSPEEWEDACLGPERASFPYGSSYVARKCNTRGREVAPSGSFPECMSASGAIDMSGNAAEWDSTGAVRGASAIDGSRGRCSEKREVTPTSSLADVGFRCCADPVAEVGPGK